MQNDVANGKSSEDPESEPEAEERTPEIVIAEFQALPSKERTSGKIIELVGIEEAVAAIETIDLTDSQIGNEDVKASGESQELKANQPDESSGYRGSPFSFYRSYSVGDAHSRRDADWRRHCPLPG